MIELNRAFLASLIFAGYKFMLCIPDAEESIIRLHPLREQTPDIIVNAMSAYLLPIGERELHEMADGVEDFQFYIAEDLLDNNKES